ncbi:antibiotic biosynthesis monooxygenase [Bacillus safensis]|uniref:antibiotic biosynthesis monooxygenase family protein n=1 Tax=Bacillus safensis TaxID=561879 RepID=UPI002E238046|nr:antibiotic biosynthesis monooxygenase [Bacillus safensis]
MLFTQTPAPPYYAAIFTSKRTNVEQKEYAAAAQKMEELAKDLDGFLGMESVRDEYGVGITVSYWDSLEAIKEWKAHTAHQRVQKKGEKDWYESYTTRICKVEHAYTNKDSLLEQEADE